MSIPSTLLTEMDLGPSGDFAREYFGFLLEQHRKSKTRRFWISDSIAAPAGFETVFPLSALAPERKAQIPIASYRTLLKTESELRDHARSVTIGFQPLQAGSGSSLKRDVYLNKRFGKAARLGAKGTDLFVTLPSYGEEVSLAELQWLKMMRLALRGDFKKVIVQDLVGPETQMSIQNQWNKPCPLDPSQTYLEFFADHPSALSRSGATLQPFMPTIDERGELTTARTAPPGHAYFAVKILKQLVSGTDCGEIFTISNGEDLASNIDPVIAGWMKKNRIPLLLVTTDKTPIDTKGGVLGATLTPDGKKVESIRVIETAQAEENGQKALYANLSGQCSTNLSLFNSEALSEKLARIPQQEFLSVIQPDLIRNKKSQTDPDGITRSYIQLEGAMGSTLMNLDAYWRRKFGEPLIHLLNVELEFRDRFFTPLKTAFDFYLVCHSDRYCFDEETWMFRDQRKAMPPLVTFEQDNGFYSEVQNVLDAFEGASIRDLDELTVTGRVSFKGKRLVGKETISS